MKPSKRQRMEEMNLPTKKKESSSSQSWTERR
ncbi:hypothetical protein LINPERPRIM_LOCUS15137 [Linum perenne]